MKLAPKPHPRTTPLHARAYAPEAGYHVDSKGERQKSGPHNPAHIGPDTVLILSNHDHSPDRMPMRAHEHMTKFGKLPHEVTRRSATQHPGDLVQKMGNMAHKELPMGGDMLPQQAPMPMPQLPMAGGM